MIGALVNTAVGLIGGAIGMIGGNKAAKEQKKLAQEQGEQANKMRQEALDNRIDYKTPNEINDMLNAAKAEAAQGSDLVQSAQETADKSLANQTSGITRSATSGAQALAAINSASDNATDKVLEAQEKQLAIDESRKENVTQAQSIAAGFADKEYDVNVQQEFDRVYGESQDLAGASIQNKQGAINAKAEAMGALGKALGGAGATVAENVDFSGGGSKRQAKRQKKLNAVVGEATHPGLFN